MTNVKWKSIGLFFLCMIVLLCFVGSICFGVTDISFRDIINAFRHYDETDSNHVIIKTTRLSRAIIALIIGASLAIAGALMQALTRNPLASPSIFGINSGAIFFVVLATIWFSSSSLVVYMWFAFFGAAISAFIVYFLGSIGRDGIGPIKLVLAGAAISALFNSFTQALLVMNEKGLQEVLFWLTGSVAGRTLDMLYPLLPFIFGAILLAFLITPALNIMMSGEDVAKGLGVRTTFVKVMVGLIVVCLAGASVAVAGAIGFVGLIIPHIARFLVGLDQRWVIAYSGCLGAILLLIADISARFFVYPAEIPIGVMTAFIGIPFFIYIVRKGVVNG
ncbi:MAG: iron ABC transporter permease [Bacillaceae bacterium]|nr:iron ABC transporter permease [Bacillaceae bacterium]